jgi:hypothetical protein
MGALRTVSRERAGSTLELNRQTAAAKSSCPEGDELYADAMAASQPCLLRDQASLEIYEENLQLTRSAFRLHYHSCALCQMGRRTSFMDPFISLFAEPTIASGGTPMSNMIPSTDGPTCTRCGSQRTGRIERKGFIQKTLMSNLGYFPGSVSPAGSHSGRASEVKERHVMTWDKNDPHRVR